MIRLSDRLQVIADQITPGETVCDIGTDHGFLPLYLYERNIASHVILADISSSSLEKARENCEIYYPGTRFDLRLGNGLEVISEGEADTVVIAGMGGILMSEILQADMNKTKSVKKFIFQPRSAAGRLRHWLLTSGFEITSDRLVEEGRFICSVITAVPAAKPSECSLSEDDIRMEIPEYIRDEELADEYIRRRIEMEKRVLSGLSEASEKWTEKTEKTKSDIEYLEGLLCCSANL